MVCSPSPPPISLLVHLVIVIILNTDTHIYKEGRCGYQVLSAGGGSIYAAIYLSSYIQWIRSRISLSRALSNTLPRRMPLSVQHFSHNPLDRSIGNRKNESFLAEVLLNPCTVAVLVKSEGRTGKVILCEKSIQDNRFSLLKLKVDALLKFTEHSSVQSLLEHFVIVLLGYEHESSSWCICIDLASKPDLIFNSINAGKLCEFKSGRAALTELPRPELAIAGQALAMAGWHAANCFCGKTGFPTIPIECGMKRGVPPADSSGTRRNWPTKLYPRIDPVAIAAIISPDQQSILLGNMKSYPHNLFSCLSGFVEPCESVENAVCREVWEEAGVRVDLATVTVVGTQPWPIGRGGGCEIMIGCIATARTINIAIQDSDVREVRWFSRDEARAMLTDAENRIGLPADSKQSFVPGQYAIAYHLIKAFVDPSGKDDDGKVGNGIDSNSCTRAAVSMYWLIPVLFYGWAVLSSRR